MRQDSFQLHLRHRGLGLRGHLRLAEPDGRHTSQLLRSRQCSGNFYLANDGGFVVFTKVRRDYRSQIAVSKIDRNFL